MTTMTQLHDLKAGVQVQVQVRGRVVTHAQSTCRRACAGFRTARVCCIERSRTVVAGSG